MSVPQVLLRWSIQRGFLPVFGTDDETHLKSDLALDGFALSDDEVVALDALDRMDCAYDPFQKLWRGAP